MEKKIEEQLNHNHAISKKRVKKSHLEIVGVCYSPYCFNGGKEFPDGSVVIHKRQPSKCRKINPKWITAEYKDDWQFVAISDEAQKLSCWAKRDDANN